MEHVSAILHRALKQVVRAAESGDDGARRQLHVRAEMGDVGAARYLNQPFGLETESPIEKEMVNAILDCARSRFLPEVYEDQRDTFIDAGGGALYRLETQAPIGPYRADILLSQRNGSVRIVVECDGHDFHERTPEQAAHDKRRDRFLQASGYRVFRFTGREVHRNATACADEVLDAAVHLSSSPGAA